MNIQHTIQNKIIIVTGATQGIGLSTAKLLSEQGAIVVLVARSEDALKDTASQIPNSFAVRADMRSESDIKNVVQKVIEKYGRIDIVINNAGQGMNSSIETINIDDYRSIIELNVIGALRMMQAVIPIMKQQNEGQIINISSVVSKNAFPNLGAYASTKYALNALSLTAREELKGNNITVSLVHPGLTDTNFGINLIATEEAKAISKAMFEKMPPVDSPDLVAQRILDAIESKEAEVFVK